MKCRCTAPVGVLLPNGPGHGCRTPRFLGHNHQLIFGGAHCDSGGVRVSRAVCGCPAQYPRCACGVVHPPPSSWALLAPRRIPMAFIINVA